MKLVIDQENELSGTKTALEKAHAELQKLQYAWTEREDNEKLQTKSKAEALSKALVDSWSASLPADMMTDENKQAIFALAQNFPQESVKMMEIAHKASKKYKSDMDSLAAQQQAKQKRQLESRVMDIVTKKRRIVPDTKSVVHETSCIVGCNADGDDVPEDRRMNSHDKKAEMCVENCGDNGLCSEACTQYFNYLAGCMTTQNEGEFANVAAAASERFKSKGTSLLRGDDDPVVRNATPMLFCGLWAGF